MGAQGTWPVMFSLCTRRHRGEPLCSQVSLEDNFARLGFPSNVSGSFETLAWLFCSVCVDVSLSFFSVS